MASSLEEIYCENKFLHLQAWCALHHLVALAGADMGAHLSGWHSSRNNLVANLTSMKRRFSAYLPVNA